MQTSCQGQDSACEPQYAHVNSGHSTSLSTKTSLSRVYQARPLPLITVVQATDIKLHGTGLHGNKGTLAYYRVQVISFQLAHSKTKLFVLAYNFVATVERLSMLIQRLHAVLLKYLAIVGG